jgi:lipoprotein-releasing system permease protein
VKAEFFISLRYLMTKRKEKFISLISIISILGVAIGVASLIVVIAVMTGFDRDLRDKIVGNYSHITVSSFNGIDRSEYNWIKEQVALNPHVRGISPYLQGQVFVIDGNRFFATALKGIEPDNELKVSQINKYMSEGSLANLRGESVVLGKELASFLGLRLGSKLSINSPSGIPYNLKVIGIFNSGMYDYDMNLILTDLNMAQDIFMLKDKVGAISIKLDNLYLAEEVKKDLNSTLDRKYNLSTWIEKNRNFFAALKLEKLTMFIILTLIILVASFNIISTLMVMVVEKTKDIGILKAIGMNSRSIRKIFTWEGLMIGSLGIFLGTAIGLILCALLKKYQFIKLPQDIYYIDKLPVALDWLDISLIILSALLIALLSTIYPASKAARLHPVEALRYE